MVNNFDTGHAHSSKENLPLIPSKIGNLIYGTHLKDNFGTENLALAPGEGSIPWKQTLAQLKLSGYAGSYDLEIVCQNPNEVEQTYRKAKAYVEGMMKEITKEAYI
ncbi:MAG: sugar phosphate isomerase/epimerase family protein [Sphaerochaetaceae bacterium]